jgi:hypothetical protein
MPIICLSFTGENTTGEASFTLVNTYKFKDLFIDDVKFQMSGTFLQESISKSTSAVGSTESDTTIYSPLYLKMDFLDNKDVKLYSLSDAVNNTSSIADASDSLNTAQNHDGMIPIGYPRAQGSSVSTTTSYNHFPRPLHVIRNRPQMWEAGKVIKFTLFNRNIDTDGLIKDINLLSTNGSMGGTAFGDECNVDIVLRLE